MYKKAMFKDTEDWENVPAFISDCQREDPIESIRNFCCWWPLSDMRFKMQDAFRAAMGSKLWKDDTPEDKLDRIFIFDELINLVECAYVLDLLIDQDLVNISIKAKEK